MRWLLTFAVASALLGQPTESSVLGGSCLSEAHPTVAEIQAWHSQVTAYAVAARKWDRASALELAKGIVRGRCSNIHWRFTLIDLLADESRFDEAVAVLGGAPPNAVPARIAQPTSAFRKLLSSREFGRSKIAVRLRQDQLALDQRHAEARSRLATAPAPAKGYIAKGACPFECCRFGNWSASRKTFLHDMPGGSTVVAEVLNGARVFAVTGEVHLMPVPVLVRFAAPYGFRAPVGSIVFLLNRTGEGHGQVWVNGKVSDSEHMHVQNSCGEPRADCWGEFLDRGGESQWWVQIRLANGKTGWTREAMNFSGSDGCG